MASEVSRIFLLSPANCGGNRARIVMSERATFDLAVRLRQRDGVSIGEVFAFMSGLYFRGKLAYGLAFANDGRTVLYVRPDDAMRPFQVWRHTIGTPSAGDALVYQEDDERYFVSVDRSRSGRVLVITSASISAIEARISLNSE